MGHLSVISVANIAFSESCRTRMVEGRGQGKRSIGHGGTRGHREEKDARVVVGGQWQVVSADWGFGFIGTGSGHGWRAEVE